MRVLGRLNNLRLGTPRCCQLSSAGHSRLRERLRRDALVRDDKIHEKHHRKSLSCRRPGESILQRLREVRPSGGGNGRLEELEKGQLSKITHRSCVVVAEKTSVAASCQA